MTIKKVTYKREGSSQRERQQSKERQKGVKGGLEQSEVKRKEKWVILERKKKVFEK